MARQIEGLAAAIRRETTEGGSLVVFPEGEILNFLSGRVNPVQHKLYIPGYLTDANEGSVLAELEKRPPTAVVLWRRLTTEYSRGSFGEDYGRRIAEWIASNYEARLYGVPGGEPSPRARATLAVRKVRVDAGGHAAPPRSDSARPPRTNRLP